MPNSLKSRISAFLYERRLSRLSLPSHDGMPEIASRLPDNWSLLDARSQRAFTYEFRLEVTGDHPLGRIKETALVVATADGSDDVLAWNSARTDDFYLVHLTWAGKPDRLADRFPAARPIGLHEL